jgi:hypothetical protein
MNRAMHAVARGGALARELRELIQALDQAAALDRVIDERTATDPPLAGLPLALRLTALLLSQRRDWADMIADDAMLAKLCGRLGSAFAAEQEASYVHALRHLRRRRTRWGAVLRCPADFGEGVGHAARGPDVAPGAPAAARTPGPSRHAPPEKDWLTTIERLIALQAWRDESELLLLRSLAAQGAPDAALNAADVVWLRDLWWDTELRAPLAPVTRP